MKNLAKSLAAPRCLVIATSLIAAMPLVGTAQESPAAEVTSQRRFVSDKLVLNVYADAEQGSARVATIQTGDAVDELERVGNMVHVRLDDGREGWVGANYLVSDAPATVRLRELQRQQPSTAAPRIDKALVEEVAQLKKQNTTLRGQVNELQARVTAAAQPINQGVTTNETSMPDTVTEAEVLASAAPTGGMWGWLVAIMFVGAAGFASGYQTLARRLRKKFGGLKIY